MSIKITVRLFTTLVLFACAVAPVSATFINEIHYDNTGTDTGEFIEIAGEAGTDVTGWQLLLYNGVNGTVYNTRALVGTIPDQLNGFGTLLFTYPTNGIQNGAPDGIVLLDSSGVVVQFLSYEGAFAATNGPATGLTSTDMGAAEGPATPVGFSLQLTGVGSESSDFTWSAPLSASPGAVNVGQTLEGAQLPAPIPTLSFYGLLILALSLLALSARQIGRGGLR